MPKHYYNINNKAHLYEHTFEWKSKQAEIYFINLYPFLKKLDEFISSLIKTFKGNWVIFGIRVLTLS